MPARELADRLQPPGLVKFGLQLPLLLLGRLEPGVVIDGGSAADEIAVGIGDGRGIQQDGKYRAVLADQVEFHVVESTSLEEAWK